MLDFFILTVFFHFFIHLLFFFLWNVYKFLKKVIFQTYFNNYVEKYRTGIRMLEKRKVKHEDWNLFQMCLTLMQTIGIFIYLIIYNVILYFHWRYFCIINISGEFLGNIENFEKALTADITEINNKISVGNIFGQYKVLLLTTAGRTELQNLVSSIQKGFFKIRINLKIWNFSHFEFLN